jgi:hypothetical protein
LPKLRLEGLLNTEIGSHDARTTNEPIVVQSYLRVPVPLVTSAFLSYRNRIAGRLIETRHNGYGGDCYRYISSTQDAAEGLVSSPFL